MKSTVRDVAKKVITQFLKKIGLRILTHRGWNQILELAADREKKIEEIRNNQIDLNFIGSLSGSGFADNFLISRYLQQAKNSKSGFRQDVIALALNSFTTEGFFIEVGACDGIATSNSLLLERDFKWKGILIEPAIVWHEDLKRNRSAIIDTRCAWRESGISLLFEENQSPGHSGINATGQLASNAKVRYQVETITLNDLLFENKIKGPINFLSIDTEGSELDVLKGLNFDLHRPRFICVEHNFEIEKRGAILEMMSNHGYHRLLPEFSFVDDWYIAES
jgi:FkbM family methyltransferase